MSLNFLAFENIGAQMLLLYFTIALFYKFSSMISPTMAIASISTLAPLGNAAACKKKRQIVFMFSSVLSISRAFNNLYIRSQLK